MNTTQATTNRVTADDVEASIACEVYIGGVNLVDSMRFLWLTDRSSIADERRARARILDNMAVMETDDVRKCIDTSAAIGPAINAIGATFDTVTICLMVLQNGTKIVGVNHGPVDPAGFSADDGRTYARQDAIRQIWPLLGFELRNKLIDAQASNEGQVAQ